MARPGFDDPQWYRRAVFYEVFLRGFADSSGDGSGDLRGLTERLDHLDWLGVDCVWLLPFYASPLRDGGYDISDYMTVLPEFGQVQDVADLVEAAHARGMRVIAEPGLLRGRRSRAGARGVPVLRQPRRLGSGRGPGRGRARTSWTPPADRA